jgi:inosine kinase
MKFPGRRKYTHFFPVKARDPLLNRAGIETFAHHTHVVGIDQTLVDIEACVSDDFLDRHGLSKGHSLVVESDRAEAIYAEISSRKLIVQEHAGGTVGNTLHNYSVLADDNSILLGVMSECIHVGTSGYRYLCNTSSRVNLNHLQPVDGPIGRCFALITPDHERTFAISEGAMNQLRPESIPRAAFEHASALVLTAYLMRCKPGDPMPEAALQAIAYAKEAGVPVVLTLGTKHVIAERPAFWKSFIRDHVSFVAMNEEEGKALTGHEDPLLACAAVLDLADMVLCTAGPDGLYMAGHVDESAKRETRYPLLPGAIPEFNRHEFSRAMLRAHCVSSVRAYAYIAPYMGGPNRIANTNGAGDGALSAVLHDIAANRHHRDNVPNSSKHKYAFLTYSSLAQVCRYANRVSYEVLAHDSPRLTHGLPEREDSLKEEAYWAQ